MIILNKHKLIILKNPKTAGTSLRLSKTFSAYGMLSYNILDDISVKTLSGGMSQFFPFDLRDLPPDAMEALRKRISSTDDPIEKINQIAFACFPIYGNFQYYIDLDKKLKQESSTSRFCNSNLEEYTAYVVMRNPIDRFKSMVRHARSKSDIGLIRFMYEDQFQEIMEESDKRILYRPINPGFRPLQYSDFSEAYRKLWESFSFDDVARKLLEGASIDPNKNPKINFLKIPQSYYCKDPRVKILDFSNLQKEVDGLCEKYNLPPSILPKENEGIHEETDILSEETLNKIKEVYAEDIKIYEEVSNV